MLLSRLVVSIGLVLTMASITVADETIDNSVDAETCIADLPGGRPEDAKAVLDHPHEYAWQLFMALNTQARNGTAGVPERDGITRYDPDRPVVWETWALASGGRAGARRTVPNRSEVFLDKGAKPKRWADLPRPGSGDKHIELLASKRLEFLTQRAELGQSLPASIASLKTTSPHGFRILIDPTIPGRPDELFEGGPPTADEVRMNKATFDFVRDHTLHSIEGLEKAFSAGKRITFPSESQEVKAQWVRIDEKDKPKYHWRHIKGPEGEEQVWGLSGWHVITRDLPNWFWCDFEHEDYLPFAELPSIDPTTRGEQATAKGSREGVRKDTEGSKWMHYRLRGIQVDFADGAGIPSILANTQIERGFQQSSSCVTCHARATVGLRSSELGSDAGRTYSLPVFKDTSSVLIGAVGYPDPSWFRDERGRTRFLQTDFLWSLPFRSCSEGETPPKS